MPIYHLQLIYKVAHRKSWWLHVSPVVSITFPSAHCFSSVYWFWRGRAVTAAARTSASLQRNSLVQIWEREREGKRLDRHEERKTRETTENWTKWTLNKHWGFLNDFFRWKPTLWLLFFVGNFKFSFIFHAMLYYLSDRTVLAPILVVTAHFLTAAGVWFYCRGRRRSWSYGQGKQHRTEVYIGCVNLWKWRLGKNIEASSFIM